MALIGKAAWRDGAGGRGRRVPIAGVLLVGIGGLVLVAVASVLYIGLATSRQNTFDLLREKAEIAVDSVFEQLGRHLEAPRQQVEFLGGLVAAGELAIEDKARLADSLYASLAGTPQVAGVTLIDTDGQAMRVTRTGSVEIEALAGTPRARKELERASITKQSYYGDIIRDSEHEDTAVNICMPLWRNGAFVGVVMSAVTIGELSRVLSTIGQTSGGTPFVLQGRDHVFAHPNLAARMPDLAPGALLPSLDAVGDPVIARFWSPAAAAVFATPKRPQPVTARVVQNIAGVNYLFLHRQIDNIQGGPWYVGTYFRLDQVDQEVERLSRASLAGAGVLVLAILAALALSRWLGRPIRRLAQVAESVRDLDFTASGPAWPSSIRELDDAAHAFNRMLAGLRWFETYVPRQLVTRLMRESDEPSAFSEERMVTIMFTDITGFTTMAERMGAAEVASLLNHHFTMINRCVEAEEGIVDKYIGDSVMSFWNAPTSQKDHALRGVSAACAIARAVTSDNRRRESDGLPRLRMRICVHSGPAVVGNIGSPGRINYTIVGDTVNAASRIVAQHRQHDAEVTVVISSDTAEAAGLKTEDLRSLGRQSLRGRATPVEVYSLDIDGKQQELARGAGARQGDGGVGPSG